MKLLAQVQLFKRAAFLEYVCRAFDTADSVTSSLLSFTLTAYTAMVTIGRDKYPCVSGKHYTLVHFFIL